MDSYECAILARQEYMEIIEDNHSLPLFNYDEDEFSPYNQFIASHLRNEIEWKAKVNVFDTELTQEEFIMLANHSLLGFQGFKSLTEILAYIIYLEQTVNDYNNKYDEMKSLLDKMRKLI